MTKKEINAAIETATAKLDALQDTEMEIAKKQSKEYLERIQNYFQPLLESHPEVTLEKQYSGVAFYRMKDKWNKELVSLGYNEYQKVLQLNTYSTIVSCDWELERLIFVADVAKAIKADSEGITALFTFRGPLEEERREISQQGFALERELSDYKQQLRQYERIEKISNLQTEGLEFEEPITLQVKWDWSIFRVCKLRILKMTASGKSADVEITTKEPQYKYDEYGNWIGTEHEFRTRVVEKVRMDNILYAIN